MLKSSSGNASLQRPAETESLLWAKSAVCIKAVTSLPQAWLEGSYRGTNRSQWLSPTFNLGPVAGMANTETNCTYLCSGDTPVEWQGPSAVASHGPPTDSREGIAIYVRSSCCCPQQVGWLSKTSLPGQKFHLNSFSTWPLFSLPPGSACLLRSPPSYLTWVQITEMEESSADCSLAVPCLLLCVYAISVRRYQAVQVKRSTSQLSWTIHLHEEARDSQKSQSCRQISVHAAKTHTFT